MAVEKKSTLRCKYSSLKRKGEKNYVRGAFIIPFSVALL